MSDEDPLRSGVPSFARCLAVDPVQHTVAIGSEDVDLKAFVASVRPRPPTTVTSIVSMCVECTRDRLVSVYSSEMRCR